MRALATFALLAMMSLSAQAASSCLGDALTKAPEKAKALAGEILKIKATTELVGDIPFFTVGSEKEDEQISEEERTARIADNYLVPGDMMWPVGMTISKEIAIQNKISDEEFYTNIGFLVIRCKSATSPEVETMWFQTDVVAQ